MPFLVSSDYWLEVPAGRYRIGLTPAEARALAEQSAPFLEARGIDETPIEGKAMRKAIELVETAANVAWVERYLLEHFPAREVELPGYAIGRAPVTSAQFQQFMQETGETEAPAAWKRDDANEGAGVPAVGVSWNVALAVAAWAGARIPFADEWERAVRGDDHRLFPWGQQFAPIGPRTVEDAYPRVLPPATTRTAAGFDGAVNGNPEWAADYANDAEGRPWGRLVVGWAPPTEVVPSAVTRAYANPFTGSNERCMIRLVRADGRETPPVHPTTPANLRADEQTRVFESRVVVPALDAIQRTPLAHSHTIETNWSGNFWTNAAADKLATVAMGRARGLRSGIRPDPKQWVFGRYLAATSRDAKRRQPGEHGVFVWNIQYRLAEDGAVRARPVTAFRMAHDKALHRFENRFVESEPDTAIDRITSDMVRASIEAGAAYYERHADAARPPG